jgi:hypothetical protein
MRTLVASLALVLVCHCGVKGSEGGSDSGTCLGIAFGQRSSPPVDNRPSATTCTRTPNPTPGPDAAPPMSCNTDADCTTAVNTGVHCAEHVCGYDQCLVDSDCPSNQLCVCGNMLRGGLGSECVPAACHTDADCGAGNYCVVSPGYCGDITGYYCTSNRDTCVDPTRDCAACGGNSCVYTPQVGHFTCATNTCNG